MAKDKRIVAGVISDTKYYYASDGSVVDEDGKPAPAKFAAMFPPMPEQKPEPAKETKPKKTRRKLKDLAGRINNSKYYYDAEGNVVDEEGKPVNEKLAGYFGKREELRKDIPKVEPKKQTDMIDGKRLRVINSEIGKAIRSTQNLVQSNEIIQDKMTTMFDSFNDVVKTLGDQNDAIVQRLIQQNQEFQDKVIETLSGVPGATKAGGAKPKKINPRAVGGSKAARGTELKVKTTNYRETRKQEVEDRARRIAEIKTKRDIKSIVVGSLIGATAGIGAGALISAITPSTTAPSTPTPPGGAPGGTTPSGPGGGNGDTTPGSGGMTRLKTKDGYPYEVNSKFAANFKGFVDELEASGYKIKRGGIGGYSPRPGWHGKGMAIDINPDDNPMLINSGGRIINKITGRESSDLRNSKYPFGYGKDNFGSLDVGAMARKWGLGWGGNWKSSSDTMHFSAGGNEGGTGVVPEGSPQVAVGGGAAPGAPSGGTGPMAAPSGPSTGTGGVGSIQAPGAPSKVSEGQAGEQPKGKAGFKQIMDSAAKAGDPFPEVVAAQWAIESGWGKHMTGKNNPFGQTGVEGKDPGIRIPTPRDPGGGSKFFRSFESIDEAVAFRVKKWAPKYAGAKSAEEAVMMLQNYGRTPRYAQGYNNDWYSYVTSISGVIRGQGIDPKMAKGGGENKPQTQVASAGAPPKAYAAGDPYVPNTGPAIVGERGPELVIGQDGSSRLTGQGPRIENLNKGDSVIPADKTKKLMGYADGTRAASTVAGSLTKNFTAPEDIGGWASLSREEKVALMTLNKRAGGDNTNRSQILQQKNSPQYATELERATKRFEGEKSFGNFGTIDRKLIEQSEGKINAYAEAYKTNTIRHEATYDPMGSVTQPAFQYEVEKTAEEKQQTLQQHREQQSNAYEALSQAISASEPDTGFLSNMSYALGLRSKEKEASEAKKAFGMPNKMQKYADGTRPPKKTGKPIKQSEPVDNTAEIGLSLLKTGVSFIPGVGQVVAGLDAANELRKGNVTGALKAGLGAIPGGGAAMGVGRMVAGEAIDQIGNRLTSGSEQNAMQEYTKPPAVKTVIVNNNRTNNVTKTVNQGSSLPKLDRNESANPLVQSGNKRTAMGAF
jgi:hypothetical protein